MLSVHLGAVAAFQESLGQPDTVGSAIGREGMHSFPRGCRLFALSCPSPGLAGEPEAQGAAVPQRLVCPVSPAVTLIPQSLLAAPPGNTGADAA